MPDMKRIFLSGGGDEKQTFELDEVFLDGVNSILYIPVAWKNDKFDGCLDWFTNAMAQHKKVKIEMLTDFGKAKDLRSYDAVYIGGGNTFKLLKKMKDSGFDGKLLDYYNAGGTVYGGSAGAIIWGRDIGIASICADADVNEVGLKDTEGFDILKGIDIQCHYDGSQLVEHQKYIAKSGRDVIAIPEVSGLLLENKRIRVIGKAPAILITKSSSKDYNVGDDIKLPSPNQN